MGHTDPEGQGFWAERKLGKALAELGPCSSFGVARGPVLLG